MTLIAVASAKGSPGTTTLALTLAALLPQPTVLADLDPAGSDLLLRSTTDSGAPLDAERGLLSLGAAVRRGGIDLADHLQVLAGGLPVLAGLGAPEQGIGLGPVWVHMAHALRAWPGTVVADCGRLDAAPPHRPVLEVADAVLLITRSTVEQYAHLRERLRVWQAAHPADQARRNVGVLVVAPERERHVVSDLQRLLDSGGLHATVVAALAHDPKGARVLAGQAAGRPGRTTLVRSVRRAVPAVARFLAQAGAPLAEVVG